MNTFGATIHVLHVDDDPEFADVVADFLERGDDRLTVSSAMSAKEGLAKLTERNIDCIVSDYDMPGDNGIEFLTIVRSEYPDLPFILYTGKGSEAVASEAISAGVTDYLQKQGGTSQYTVLANRVKNAVERHRSQRAVQSAERKLTELAERTNDVLFMFSADWEELLFVNSAYEKIWGQSVDSLRDNPEQFLEAIVPADREHVIRSMERLSAGDSDTIEYRVRRTDEAVRWVQAEAKPIRDERGAVARIAGIARDVTDRKEREEQLRELSQFREAVIESANLWINVLDAEGNVAIWNEAAAQISGYTADEVVGHDRVWEWLYPDAEYRDQVTETAGQILHGETAVEEFETTITTKSGESRLISWHSQAIMDGSGATVGSVAIGRDITERKRYEEELERTRDFFTEAEDLGNLGAWEVNEDGSIIWTDGTRRIHGVGADYEPTLEEALEFFHPQDRETIAEAVEVAFERGESYEQELRLITAQGQQRWVRTRGKVLDEEGSRTIRGYIQDITEQQSREAELQQARGQLENAIEAGAVGTWEWHIPADRLVAGREFARTFGVDPDLAREGIGIDRFVSSIHEDHIDRVEQQIEAAMTACGDYEAEYRVRDANDQLRWVLARGHVECDDDGTPVKFPGVLVDITERKHMEQELQRQNESLNQFAGVVSHDLRNPLNVIKGRVELARGSEVDEHLESIESAAERMDAIIEDLLLLAREGQDIGELSSTVLADAFEEASKMVPNPGDQARFQYSDEALSNTKIKADPDRLVQVFENLLRNALEHGGEDVTVSFGLVDGGFYLEDDGPGISDKSREKVFTPGYSTKADGTGFGLSIVKRIIEAHDWEIHVTEGSRGGARFEITGVEFASG